jgi:hypothetical protein
MITNMTKPTPDATRLRMPAGTCARTAPFCADVELYVKGTVVFADRAASATARPHALDIPGVRSWSPPV